MIRTLLPPPRPDPTGFSNLTLVGNVRGASANGVPTPDAAIIKDPALVATYQDEFFRTACAKKLSLNHKASYHVAFAMEIKGLGSRDDNEKAWKQRISDMDIRFIGETLGSPSERIPPFAGIGKSNPSVPSLNVVFSTIPQKHLTFEYNTSTCQPWIKGSRGVIIEHLRLIIAYFGRAADINAQKMISDPVPPHQQGTATFGAPPPPPQAPGKSG